MPEAPRLAVLLIWEFLHWYASPGPLLLTGEVAAERIVYFYRVGSEEAGGDFVVALYGRKQAVLFEEKHATRPFLLIFPVAALSTVSCLFLCVFCT